jgi:ribosome recycling factor
VAEVTNEPMLEVLKQVHGEQRDMKESLRDIRQELISIRGHMTAMQNDISNTHSILGRHDDRLDRIEARLNLSEVI